MNNLRKFNVLKSALAAVFALGCFAALWLFLTSEAVSVIEPESVRELELAELDNCVALLPEAWEWYPECFALGADFASLDPPKRFNDAADAGSVRFGTHRLVLHLEPDKIYSICGYSVDYSTRVFANEKLVAESGVPSADPKTAVPRINYLELPVLTDSDGRLELVLHYSNYWHTDGGGIGSLYISTPENIRCFNRCSDLPVMLLCGGLLMFALYFAVIGAVRRSSDNIMLAVCCVIFAFRNQNFYVKMLLSPNYNWFVHYRIIVLIIALMPFAVLALICSMYSKKLLVERLPIAVCFSVTLLASIFMFAFPTSFSSYIGDVIVYCALPFAVYVVYCAALNLLKTKKIERADAFTVLGVAILCLGFLFEVRFNRSLPAVTRGGVTPMCMLVFVMIMAIVQSLRALENERELEDSRRHEKVLEQINTANSEFFRKITHELKTPLTVISGYAQLNARRVSRGMDSEKTIKELDIVRSEAERLADMVTRLAEYSYGKKSDAVMSELDASSLCSEATAILSPICAKRGNQLSVSNACSSYVLANRELIMQVFVNLVVNANKHTENGSIIISSRLDESGKSIIFEVSDSGEGIPDELREKIFEKGYSTDGGSGLGLTICADIMKTHGGKIYLEPDSGGRTAFAFELPRA